MTLELGELVAKMRVDDSKVDSGLAKGHGKIKKFGAAIGVGLGAAGAAAGGMLAAGISTSIEREAIGDKFAQQYPDPEVAKRAGQAAGSLYANAWGENLTQANQYVQQVVTSIPDMDKASANTVAKMTERYAALGQVFEIDVGGAAAAAGIMVRNGLAKDGADAADQLTVALRKVPTVMREDLIDAVSEYSPYIADLGLSGGQALAVFSKWGAEGKVGIDKAGDSLKEFGIRAADGSAASVNAFKTLGLNADKMTKNFAKGGPAAKKSFNTVVDELLKIRNPAKQAQTAIALFGTPLEDIGTQNIPAFLSGLKQAKTGMGDTAGAADKMAAAVGDNAAGKIEMAKRRFESWTTQMAAGVAGLGTFGAAALGVGPSLVGMLTPMAMMTVAIQGMNLAFLASPVTWIILGLVALGVALYMAYTKVGWFRDFVNVSFRIIKSVALAVGHWIAGPFVRYWVGMAHGAMTAFRGLMSFIGGAWSFIKTAFNIGKNVISTAARLGFLGPIPAIISNWSRIMNFFRELPGRIRGFLSGLAGQMRSAGVAIIRALADGMASMAHAAVQKVRDIVSSISNLIPHSPVKTGPLTVLNNGRAGRQLVRMLVQGIDAEGHTIPAALSRALRLPGAPAGGLGAQRPGYAARGGREGAEVVVRFEGGSDPWMVALRKSVRVVGQGDSQEAIGVNSIPVQVMG